MAVYTTENAVREKFQVLDTARVPSTLVTRAMEDAHRELVRFLAPEWAEEPVEEGVVFGETLLAGAHLFRSLAAKDAFEQRNVTVGRERVEAGRRHSALTAVAARAEERAWHVLEPYLAAGPRGAGPRLSATRPVLGA